MKDDHENKILIESNRALAESNAGLRQKVHALQIEDEAWRKVSKETILQLEAERGKLLSMFIRETTKDVICEHYCNEERDDCDKLCPTRVLEWVTKEVKKKDES